MLQVKSTEVNSRASSKEYTDRQTDPKYRKAAHLKREKLRVTNWRDISKYEGSMDNFASFLSNIGYFSHY